jgi:methyl-accepting chemotaxis protein
VVFAVIVLVVWKISNVIGQADQTPGGFAEDIAQGNMDFIIEINDKSETGQLADAFRDVQKAVAKMVNDVEKTAEEIIAGDLLNRADLTVYPGEYGKNYGRPESDHGFDQLSDPKHQGIGRKCFFRFPADQQRVPEPGAGVHRTGGCD